MSLVKGAVPDRWSISDAQPESASRRLLRVGFGCLWLLDALLQLQPPMFRMDMISDIMQPAAQGEPWWLRRSIDAAIHLVTPHIVAFNLAIVLIQAAIGVLLLARSRSAVRLGLLLAIGWSLLVWWFGEGLGALFTGTASYLTGAPGSVVLYGLAAVLLLRPERPLRLGRRRLTPATALTAALFLVDAALQVNPTFFTPLGLASLFGQGAMMPAPHLVEASLAWAASLADRAPVVLNAAFVAVPLVLGLLLLRRAPSRALALTATVFLGLVWWFGQDVGGLLGGMATDPNTAVPQALLLWAAFAGERERWARPHAAGGTVHGPGLRKAG
jgi:hypothetical protein